jgi:excinuclease ABC subunit A
MQFMADVSLVCESCGGKRFKSDILEVKYHGYSIYDLLEMTIDDAVEFFGKQKESYAKKTAHKLACLQDVGLGYLKLGQSSNTLSGGESQRVKLAAFLNKDVKDGSTLFIFDEPTTGLHFHDIHKLLQSFQSLIEKGNSIIVIEHNMDVVQAADWVIDLGPEGGEGGGELCFSGTPEDLAQMDTSYTGKFLGKHLVSSGNKIESSAL